MELRQRNVLLTGATGGIGHAIARAVATRGGSLVITGRRAAVLEPLAAETGARAVACDLSSRDELDRLLGEVGDIDVLIANAALPGSGLLTSFYEEEIDAALDVNLRAPIVLARRLAEPMAARGGGHMVFVSSLAGKAASGGGSIYSATKFGLRGFALALREDLRPRGVGVSVVFPGFIRGSGMFADADVELPRFVGTKTPEEVADGVVRAIEHNRPEVDVAPLGMRAGAKFAGLAPGINAAVQRRLGAEKIASDMAEGQRDKRR